MSEHEQEQGGAAGGTAVKALAAAAAGGAATYAVRKALSARNSGDGRSREDEEEAATSRGDEPEAENEDEGDEDVEDEPDAAASQGAGSRGSKLRQVSSSAFAGAGPALVPLVEGAADSVGRYAAEHAPELLRDHVIPQFIDAYKRAS